MRKRLLSWATFDFISVGFLLVLSINLVVPVVIATAQGVGMVTWELNKFGEQWLEVVLFPLWVVMGFVVLFRLGQRVRK